jgi:hypothetical protein
MRGSGLKNQFEIKIRGDITPLEFENPLHGQYFDLILAMKVPAVCLHACIVFVYAHLYRYSQRWVVLRLRATGKCAGSNGQHRLLYLIQTQISKSEPRVSTCQHMLTKLQICPRTRAPRERERERAQESHAETETETGQQRRRTDREIERARDRELNLL